MNFWTLGKSSLSCTVASNWSQKFWNFNTSPLNLGSSILGSLRLDDWWLSLCTLPFEDCFSKLHSLFTYSWAASKAWSILSKNSLQQYSSSSISSSASTEIIRSLNWTYATRCSDNLSILICTLTLLFSISLNSEIARITASISPCNTFTFSLMEVISCDCFSFTGGGGSLLNLAKSIPSGDSFDCSDFTAVFDS